MTDNSMETGEHTKESFSLHAEKVQTVAKPSGSSQALLLLPMSGSVGNASITTQALNQLSFKQRSSTSNNFQSCPSLPQKSKIANNNPMSADNSIAISQQLVNPKKMESNNANSILCVTGSGPTPSPPTRTTSEVFIKTSSGHYTVLACRAEEIKSLQNANANVSFARPKAGVQSTRSLHSAPQTIISSNCEVPPLQQQVKAVTPEQHSNHQIENLTDPKFMQVESNTQSQEGESVTALRGNHQLVMMGDGGNMLQGDHQVMHVEKGHSMIQVRGQDLVQEAAPNMMGEHRQDMLQEGHHVVELGEQIIQMDDGQDQQHLSQKQLVQVNQEHLIEDGQGHQIVEVDGQQVVLVSGQLDINSQQEQQQQQQVLHNQNIGSCSIVQEDGEGFVTGGNETDLGGVEETVVSTELHSQQAIVGEGVDGEECIDSVQVELSSQNNLELMQEQLHSRRHLFRALLDEEEDDENEGLSGQLVNVQQDEEGRGYHEDREGESLNLESCIEQIWTEEQLLTLIVAVTSKRGWRNMDNVASFYQELMPTIATEGDLSWQAIQHKWLQLYSTYSALLNQEELNIPASATESALFTALRDADLRSDEENLDSDAQAPEHVKNGKEIRNEVESVPPTRRKSPEFLWNTEITRRFINLRADMHGAIAQKGHTAVYQEVLEQLDLTNRVTVMMARKKWNYLVNRYQDECASGGPRRWVMMADMARVMDRFAGLDTSKLKSRASPEFLWPDELTMKFIDLRIASHEDFVKLGIQNTYNKILHELGLEHILTPHHLRKKWNYLVAKHKEISSSSSISLHTGNNGTTLEFPNQWPFYDRMTAAIAALPSSSLATDGSGGNAAITATTGHPTATGSTTKSEHLWTRNSVLRFIKLRAARSQDTKNLSALYS